MRIGEEKKDGNQYQDSFSPWREAQLHIPRRNKAQSPSQGWNPSTWPSSMPSKSKFGSSTFSEKLATTSAIKISYIVTTKASLHWHTIRNSTLVQNTLTSNITSSGIALKMERHSWNIVQRRTW